MLYSFYIHTLKILDSLKLDTNNQAATSIDLENNRIITFLVQSQRSSNYEWTISDSSPDSLTFEA